MKRVLQDDIRVIFRDMPPSIRAVTSTQDDFFTVIINSRCSHAAQKEAYKHELSHIEGGDFDKFLEEASEIEIKRHK